MQALMKIEVGFYEIIANTVNYYISSLYIQIFGFKHLNHLSAMKNKIPRIKKEQNKLPTMFSQRMRITLLIEEEKIWGVIPEPKGQAAHSHKKPKKLHSKRGNLIH